MKAPQNWAFSFSCDFLRSPVSVYSRKNRGYISGVHGIYPERMYPHDPYKHPMPERKTQGKAVQTGRRRRIDAAGQPERREILASAVLYWLDKEKMLGLGVYPRLSLAQAREKREEAKKLLAQGIDPSAAKKQAKREAVMNAENTFEVVAREWHGKKTESWAPRTGEKILSYLEKDVFPYIGKHPIADIDPPELLDTLRKIETRKAYYAANRMKQVCGQIFRYGVATGKCERDAAADLKGALTTAKTKHLAALNIKEIPEFLQKLDKNEIRLFPQTRRGIRLL